MRWMLCSLLCLLFLQPVLAAASTTDAHAVQQLALPATASTDLPADSDNPEHSLLSALPALADNLVYPSGTESSLPARQQFIRHHFARGPPITFLA